MPAVNPTPLILMVVQSGCSYNYNKIIVDFLHPNKGLVTPIILTKIQTIALSHSKKTAPFHRTDALNTNCQKADDKGSIDTRKHAAQRMISGRNNERMVETNTPENSEVPSVASVTVAVR